ncbi:hypothetical protein GLOIN_2v1840951 [Rhizophagus clarus]|uniref:Uncharacterized protein n=1 Tax=Rhizophagus clarus TaxID=94130 RepID=A0A8H3QHA0_9GLOM|nr:hypothetical protein GLOIN_2v1840951 [Rhizophagus clarus]
MPPKNITRSQNKKQSVVPTDKDIVTSKTTSRSQKKNQNVTTIDDEISDSLIPKENQELETQKPPAKKRGRKKKDPANDNETINDIDQQTISPNTTKQPAVVNEDLNEDIDVQEPAAVAITKLTPINKLLELSDDDDLSEDGGPFNENDTNFEREPLTPIANDSNRIHNNILDETGSYTRVDRIRNNDLYRSNKADESRRLYLNTTPSPDRPNNIPPPTSRSHSAHNMYMGSNDRDVFRPDTQNVYQSNTSFFTNNDDSDALSNCRPSSDRFPTPFHNMANVHQICSWLCANPNILLLAYNLYLSMQSPVTNSFNFITPNHNSLPLATSIPQQEDRTKDNRDFLEELKCLFLRVRNPEKNVFEDLVRQIFNCNLNSTEGIELLRAANRNFSDFRNKFLDHIEETVNEFKKKRSRGNGNNRPLEENEVILFVDEALTMNVLQRWLNATNINELKVQNSLCMLQKFIRKALIVNYDSRDTTKTKYLDKITKNIAVPSRNGRNIASNLYL